MVSREKQAHFICKGEKKSFKNSLYELHFIVLVEYVKKQLSPVHLFGKQNAANTAKRTNKKNQMTGTKYVIHSLISEVS